MKPNSLIMHVASGNVALRIGITRNRTEASAPQICAKDVLEIA